MREVPVRFRRQPPPEGATPRLEALSAACHAPTAQLHFSPNGDVRSCCVNDRHLGNVTRSTLREIWDGERRRDLHRRLAAHDYSGGCEGCGASIALEGRSGSYPELFDDWAPAADYDDVRWPVRMEFNLSNACNLQCLQCDGELSSSIRVHREHRSPLGRPYGESFFDELTEFLPHLEYAQFAGGEPFLGPENYRVWEMIEATIPSLRCGVVTNATQWSERIRRVVERMRMGFTFSIDGISQETYESIRVGSDFSTVMENVDRLIAVARANDMPTAVNHCLMPQNHHEFGDLLLWAEGRGLPVNVSVVRTPAHASIAHLPVEDIREIHELLAARSADVAPRLHLNRATWDAELARICSWASEDVRGAATTWDAPRHTRILEFVADGRGPCDDRQARTELAAMAANGRVFGITIASDDTICRVDPAVHELPWLVPDELIGQPAESLQERFEEQFGSVVRQEVLRQGEDRLDVLTELERASVRTAMVPLRGIDGWAQEASLIVAFGPR